jgi:hypothetical protein
LNMRLGGPQSPALVIWRKENSLPGIKPAIPKQPSIISKIKTVSARLSLYKKWRIREHFREDYFLEVGEET